MLTSKNIQNLVFYYRANSVDEKVLDHSFDRDIFYPEISDLIVDEPMTIIDVGAHIGTFSILSHLKFRDSQIISIEPNPDTYAILTKNIESNRIENITPIEAALNYRSGPVKLYLSEENWEHSITSEFNGDFVEVKGITLDQLLTEYQIQSCDLIKMNCEGAEFHIIQQLSDRVLSNVKMFLILFHEDLVDERMNRHVLIKYLKDRGFAVRESQMRKTRGWLIAKNQEFYKTILPKSKLKGLWSFIKNGRLNNVV